jgi:lactoylglutathione lyase
MGIVCVGTVSIFVSNQDRAKAFYTEKLGLQLRMDNPLYPGSAARWISVAPEGAQTQIVLYLPDENWEHYRQVVGKSQAITLEVADLPALYRDLTARGVQFVHEPERQPWGTYATIEDSEGNHILLVESSNI